MSIHDHQTVGPDGQLTVRSVTGESPSRVAMLTLSAEFRARFRVGRLLGEGGMGAVYFAERLEDSAEVALKFLILGGDSDSLLRFMQEGDLLGRIDHPNVLAIHEMGMEGGLPYLVCEYLAGGTLGARIRGGPMAAAEVAVVGAAMLDGLAAIHAAGAVHRDLKPGNIMFTGDGIPKVTDLGVARFAESAEHLTRTGAMVGTPVYFAPEQARGQSATQASDIYAMGLLLHEMTAGKPPFHATDLRALLRQQMEMPPPKLTDVVPGTPPAFAQVVLAALEKDPANRPASAAELGRALRALQLPTPAAGTFAPSSAAILRTPGAVPLPLTPQRPISRATARRQGLPGARISSSALLRQKPRRNLLAIGLGLIAIPLFVALALRSPRAPAPSWTLAPDASPSARSSPPDTPSPSASSTPSTAPNAFARATLAGSAGGLDWLPDAESILPSAGAAPPAASLALRAVPGFFEKAAKNQLTRADCDRARVATGVELVSEIPAWNFWCELDRFLDGQGARPNRTAQDRGEQVDALEEELWSRMMETAEERGLRSTFTHTLRLLTQNSADARAWYSLGAVLVREGREQAADRAFAVARSLPSACGTVKWPRTTCLGLMESLRRSRELESRLTAMEASCTALRDHAPRSLVESTFAHDPALVDRMLSRLVNNEGRPHSYEHQMRVDHALLDGDGVSVARMAAATGTKSLIGAWDRFLHFEFEHGRFPLADRRAGGAMSSGKTDGLKVWSYRFCWAMPPGASVDTEPDVAGLEHAQEVVGVGYDPFPVRRMLIQRCLEAHAVDRAEALVTFEDPPMGGERWCWERLVIDIAAAGAKDRPFQKPASALLALPVVPARVMLVSEVAGAMAVNGERALGLLDAFTQNRSSSAWAPLASALAASRQGLHRAAADLARTAVDLDAAHQVPPELLLEIALRPVWDAAARGEVERPDASLLKLANRPHAGGPHADRLASYLRAVQAGDLAAAGAVARELLEDDPVAPIWWLSVGTAAALDRDAKQLAERVHELQATARYWTVNLWLMPWLAGLRVSPTGYPAR